MSFIGTRSREESGFTMIEILIAMTLMLVVLAATLTAFQVFNTNTAAIGKVTGAQDSARNRVDVMVASLRNAAGPSGSVTVVSADLTNGWDLAVNTDRPGFGVTAGTPGTARYCLDSSANGKLWFNWTPTPNTAPPASCPAAGWTQVVIINSGVANQAKGKSLFSYDSATLSAIRAARLDLYMTTRDSRAVDLQSAVFFRSLAQTASVPDSSVTTPTCSGNALSLGIDVSNDANGNPLSVTVLDNGVQVASGGGTKTLTLPTGAHHLIVRITNVLGVTQDITRDVTC